MTARGKALALLVGRTLPEEALNYRQIAQIAGAKPPAVHSALSKLHAAKMIYIARFERSKGSPVPYYLLGDLADATPPEPLTAPERQRDSLARLKSDPERRGRRLKQRSKRYYERKKDEPEEWRARADKENHRRRVRDGRPPRVTFSDPITAAVFGYQLDKAGRYVKKA